MNPDILLYLALGLGAAGLGLTAMLGLQRRKQRRPLERPVDQTVEVDWASYYQGDPHRLLRELLTDLEAADLLTRDEAKSVLRATRGGLYADALEKLCEILLAKASHLPREIYARIERLGTLLHQPEQLWTRLEKNVLETT